MQYCNSQARGMAIGIGMGSEALEVVIEKTGCTRKDG